MKHLKDIDFDTTFWERPYFVNIKLDYSAFIVKLDELGNLSYYARNFKLITKFSLENRFAILAPAIEIVKANKDSMLSEPGYYHFEYKNPAMDYKIDHRESGLWFSYYTDLEGITREIGLTREVDIDIDYIDLVNLSTDANTLLEKYGLYTEEGIVIHFPGTRESYKIVNEFFGKYNKLKRTNTAILNSTRNLVKEVFNETKGVSMPIVLDSYPAKDDLYKATIFNGSLVILNELLTDIDEKFLTLNPHLLSYLDLFRFYYPQGYELIIGSPAMQIYEPFFGESCYHLFAFIYITTMNLIEKEMPIQYAD